MEVSDEEQRPLRGAQIEDANYDAIDSQRKFSDSKKRNRCIICAGIFFTILVTVGVILLIILVFKVGLKPPIVYLECGPVEGTVHSQLNVFSFKGIPYAVPPVKERRWLPPEPLSVTNGTCWSGTYFAKNQPPHCPQIESGTGQIKADSNEDCLFLNVFAPKNDNPRELKPVIVFIHGGGLSTHGAGDSEYSPNEDITRKMNVVWVSIQYRLGPFGWMPLHLLPVKTGNLGLMDHILALKWVQTNIDKFGGDPNKVTVLGASSTGGTILGLMTSQAGKGLFHQAVLMSGPPRINTTAEQAAQDNLYFLNNSGCNTTECLYKLSMEEVLKYFASGSGLTGNGMDLPVINERAQALLVVDGSLIPSPLLDAIENTPESIMDIPLIIGNTAQEADIGPGPDKALYEWTDKDLTDYTAKHLDPFGGYITNLSLELYPIEETIEYTFTTMVGDLRFLCPTSMIASKLAKVISSPIYRYVVTSWPSSPVHSPTREFAPRYAYHGWDALAFFDGLEERLEKRPTQKDYAFAKFLQDFVANFAYTGNPGVPEWGRYPNITGTIDTSVIKPVTEYHEEQCNLWMNNGFYRYSGST